MFGYAQQATRGHREIGAFDVHGLRLVEHHRLFNQPCGGFAEHHPSGLCSRFHPLRQPDLLTDSRVTREEPETISPAIKRLDCCPTQSPRREAALSLHSFADAVILRMAAEHPDSAVVVGGGLIGCEAAPAWPPAAWLTTLLAPEPVPLQRRFGIRGRRARREDVVRHRCSLHRFHERGRGRGLAGSPGHR